MYFNCYVHRKCASFEVRELVDEIVYLFHCDVELIHKRDDDRPRVKSEEDADD